MADLNYIESGYIDDKYFVYTADADSAINSSATISCDAGKIVSSESNLSAEFTQTTYASRTKDIDLYAFTEAAIAVTIDVIRTTNVSLSTQFDVATDAIRLRNIAAQEDAFFTFSGFGERSRASSMETQAAFSISADVEIIVARIEGSSSISCNADITAVIDRIYTVNIALDSNTSISTIAETTKEFAIPLIVETSVSIIADKISDQIITIDSSAEQTADGSRIRYADSSQQSTSDVSCVISHIHGADIIANGFASLTVESQVTYGAVAPLSTIASISTQARKSVKTGSTLRSYFGLFTSKYVGTGRPWNVNSNYPTAPINSINDNWDARVKVNQEWMIEFFVNNLSGIPNNTVIFTLGPALLRKVSVSGGGSLRLEITDSSNVLRSTGTGSAATMSVGSNRITILKEGGNNRCGIWLNGTVVNSSNTIGYNFDWKRDSTFKLSTNYQLTNFNFRIGNRLNYSNGNTTQPAWVTPTNDPNYTKLLLDSYTFGTGFDDTRISQDISATLQSTATLTAGLGGPQRASANLTSISTVACAAQRTSEIILTAFTDAALTANADKIKEAQATTDADTSLSTIAEKAVEVFAQLEITTTQTSTEDRLRDNQITTDAIFSEMAVVARVADFFINCDVSSTVTCDPIKTVAIASLITSSSTQSITADKYVGFVVSANSEAILTAESYKIKQFSSTLAANSGVILTGEKIGDFIATISATFALEATSTGTIDFIALVASSGTLTVTADRTRDGISLEAGEFTLTANTLDSLAKQGSAAIDSNFNQQTNNDRIRFADAVFEAFNSQLSVVEYTADVICNVTVETTLSATPNIFKDVNADVSIAFVELTIADRIRDVESLQYAESFVVVYGTTSTDITVQLTANASVECLGQKSTETILTAFTDAALTVDANIIKSSNVTINSQVLVNNVSERIRFGHSELTNETTVTASGSFNVFSVINANAQFSVSVSTAVLHIDEYVWKIPAEARQYKIQTESRLRNIQTESRIFVIRR